MRQRPSAVATDLCLPTEGWPGWVDLGGWLDREKFSVTRIWTLDAVIHPRTNRAHRRATSLIYVFLKVQIQLISVPLTFPWSVVCLVVRFYRLVLIRFLEWTGIEIWYRNSLLRWYNFGCRLIGNRMHEVVFTVFYIVYVPYELISGINRIIGCVAVTSR